MANLREWRATIAAVILAIALILAAALGNFDLIRVNLSLLERIEKNQIDDIVFGFGLILAGVTLDRWISDRRRRRHEHLEEQRLRVLKATMRTVQDIVNNFLNNLLIFRYEADGLLPEDSLRAFDDLVAKTGNELQALGDIEAVEEKEMAAGEGIHYTSRVS